MGIYENLMDFAFDPITGEGIDSAFEKAESWRDALQEMLEIASPEEQKAIHKLLLAINHFFYSCKNRKEQTTEHAELMERTAQQCPNCGKIHPSLDDMAFCGCNGKEF